MRTWAYPAMLTKAAEDDYTIGFRDLPGITARGASRDDAIRNATEALSDAMISRVADGHAIPPHRDAAEDEVLIVLDPMTAARAALALAMSEGDVTTAELAKRMNKSEGAIRLLLDGHSVEKFEPFLQALHSLGRRATVAVVTDEASDLSTPAARPAA